MKRRYYATAAFCGMALVMLAIIAATIMEKFRGASFALEHVYHSSWLIALWALSTVSAAIYILSNYRRATLLLLHASYAIVLAGALTSYMTSRRGEIALSAGAPPASMFTTADGRLERLPFRMHLAALDTGYNAEIIIGDKEKESTRTISLNSPITKDGHTICIKGVSDGMLTLLVSHDPWGTAVSFTGYLLTFISFLSLFFDRRSGFRALWKRFQECGTTKKQIVTDGKRHPHIVPAISIAAGTVLLGIYWYRAGMFPVTNGQESLLFLAWAAFMTGMLMKFSRALKPYAPMAMTLCAIALFSALVGGNSDKGEIQPILRTPLLAIHVTTVIIAYVLIGATAINAVIALCRTNSEKNIMRHAMFGRMLLYPATMLLSAGIFIGAVWASISWGRYWGWDPKEAWALATLLACSFAFHNRSLPFIDKPRVFHIYCIAVFIIMLFTYFGVNVLLGGLHGYM